MSSSLLFRRLTPQVGSRVLHLRPCRRSPWRSFSAEPSPSADPDGILMTDNCILRMKELQNAEESSEGKMLRLSVEAGGCSGFQYVFGLDGRKNSDDRVFEKEGVKLVVDNISYDFVKGATVDYIEELIRSAFHVTSNPSAGGGCSCKSSFMVKG